MVSEKQRLKGEVRAEMIDTLRLRDGDKCWLCRNPILFWPDRHPLLGCVTIDHIVPLGEGGSNEEWNLRLAHYKCNYVRGVLMDVGKIEEVIRALLTHPDLEHLTKWTDLAQHQTPSDFFPRCCWPRSQHSLPKKEKVKSLENKALLEMGSKWQFRALDGSMIQGEG